MANKFVGHSPIRKEGLAKVTGKAMYVDDIVVDGMLHGATIRSPVAKGILKGIKFGEGVNWDAFTIVTHQDIPGENVVAFHINDQPCLVEKNIRHHAEPILLIAHESKDEIERAKRLIELDIEEQDACLSIDPALDGTMKVWGDDNIMKTILVEKGDIEVVSGSDLVTHEGTYETSAQEQMYIEPNGMIGSVEDGVVCVQGSLQCPYYVHTAMKKLFAKDDDGVRVIQTETGGAFGGKEEYPSMIACHAGLLALKSGRPVKIVYDRAEDLAATTKRHPSRTKVKSQFTPDGKLQSLDIHFIIDSGAYATVSPVVLSRGAIHAAGPYDCPNTRVACQAVATNYPPYGAFRGFGAPQSIFAIERHLDEVAQNLGISPEELRRKNLLKKGQVSSTSQTIKDDVDFEGLLNLALEKSDFKKKKKEYDNFNKTSQNIKKGIGLATFYHGAGFTGSGEKVLGSVAGVEYTPDEGVRILAASTEMGQGKNTIFAQIAADALQIPYDDVSLAQPDTFVVPNSGPTVASRTAMIVGWLVEQASEKMVALLQKEAGLANSYSHEDFHQAARNYLEKNPELKCFAKYEPAADISWDEKMYKGEAYCAYGWAAYVADVTVNLDTYETQVEHFYAVQDIGKVLHPVLCAGQVEGGVAQAIGYALCEDVVWDKGAMKNNRMTNYIIHTSADISDIQVYFQESPTPYGPGGGAKGVGELPMDGPAPAIVNAIYHATGISAPKIPVTPERLALELKRGEKS